MKDERVSLPKPKSQLEQLHDDDEDVFATSIIDRYAARPLALQDICLATFAVMYDVIQSSTETEETEDVNTQKTCTIQKILKLQKDKIAKRVGYNEEKETTGNTMYKKIQTPYRTRKILPCKAPPILPME